MGRFIVTATTSVTIVPSSFDSANSHNNNVSNTNNACKGADSTASYAAHYLVTGANQKSWSYYNFDCSSIPRKAIINSVTCTFRASNSDKNTSRMKNGFGQVSIGTDKIGTSAATFSNSSTYTVETADTGNYAFTREDLDNIKIYFEVERGDKQTTSTSLYYRIYGASLVVNYSTGYYEYDIAVSSQTEYATIIQSAYTVSEGSDINIDVQISDKDRVVIEDNSDEISSAFTLVTGTTYRYLLADVQEDHLILLSTNPQSMDYLFFKQNGQWIRARKIYKKQSNIWVEHDLIWVLNNDIFN